MSLNQQEDLTLAPTLTVNKDYTRDSRLTKQGMDLLKEFYMLPDETSPQDAFARAAIAYSLGDQELAQRIYNYASKGWFMYSSPILSNAPKSGSPYKALPISCFLSYIGDNLESIVDHQTETAWLSVKGGGVGGHWSDLRSVSKKAPGPIPFMKVVDAEMTAFMQGVTRKGSYAAYLDVSHPDVEEFIQARTPTGGDSNRKLFNTHLAVNITDDFMKAVVNDELWSFVCPHTKLAVNTTSARDFWHRILEARFKTGEPYLCFIDTANKTLPQEFKDKGLKIHGSNLCNEIYLPTSEERTAVCCLSSLNLAAFDEWKDSTIVEDLITFLDNVLTVFIANAPEALHKAKYSAMMERSLGLGMMGFHSFLQQRSIPFEGVMASHYSKTMAKLIQDRAIDQTMKLAQERGSCPDMQGLRNSHLLSVAPNANSSIICGTSSSIEPIKSNAYVHRTRAGSHLVVNPDLLKLLETKEGIDIDETTQQIILAKGSVQALECLSEHEKLVFKTAFEIDQHWVVENAAARQPYICQGQSVNLFFPFGSDRAYVESVHLDAWKKGLKGLYYLRSEAQPIKASTVKTERVALKDGDDTCIACQG